MPLDPQCQAIVDAANAAGTPFEDGDHLAVRRQYRDGTRLYRHPTPALDSVANLMLAGPAGPLPIRIYRPRAPAPPAPALVFFHGGGWVVGDLETHDHLCRYLAARTPCAVVAVDYRLAPEHPFPAAFDDACTAVRRIAAAAAEYGIDPARVAVGGDSAGGNLAAAVALALRDDVALAFQLLIYPAVDFTADNASLRENGEGYVLTARAMRQFCAWYLADAAAPTDPRVSPQHAPDHAGLPPAFIQTAEFDPLRDEAVAYAATLARAGVAVEHRDYAGMIHGFARMGGRVDWAFAAMDDAAAALRAAFAR